MAADFEETRAREWYATKAREMRRLEDGIIAIIAKSTTPQEAIREIAVSLTDQLLDLSALGLELTEAVKGLAARIEALESKDA